MPASARTTVSELARQLLIRHHSAVGLVDRLVDQGLLLRKASREDRRKVELRLTGKGRRVLADWPTCIATNSSMPVPSSRRCWEPSSGSLPEPHRRFVGTGALRRAVVRACCFI
jgi:hypothetical protein